MVEPPRLPAGVPGCVIERFVAEGGFGVVYAGWFGPDRRQVAIKIAGHAPLAEERLGREIAALSAIGPPVVPELLGHGQLPDGRSYLVMEYINWPTLAEVVADHPQGMPLALFAPCTTALIAAVAAVHERGLLHRDLKPQNIFIAADGAAVKLVDFGLARAVVAGGSLTGTGVAVGTPTYMAPEQCEGRADIGWPADVYALGIIAYEMLAGRPPFAGSSPEIREGHLARRPPRPSRLRPLPRLLEEGVLACLAKQPEKRPRALVRLGEMWARACEAAQAAPGLATVDGPPQSAGPTPAPRPASDPGPHRQKLGLLFFEADCPVLELKQRFEDSRGSLAHVAGQRGVAVFGGTGMRHPLRQALEAATALSQTGVIRRAVVDLGDVLVTRRGQGQERYASRLFSDKERYPDQDDPTTVAISAAAKELMPDLVALPLGRGGKFRPIGDALVAEPAAGPGLVGRDGLLDELVKDADVAFVARAPSIVTVIAPPGLGKSHLSAALLGRLGVLPGVRVVALYAREPVSGDTTELLRELFLRGLSLEDRASAEAGRKRLTACVGAELADELWPAVGLALGWLAADAPELCQLRAAPGALRFATMRAAGEVLRRLGQTAPLGVVLDDAQFADEMTLDALEYATLAEAHLPVWLCVLGRPAFATGRPSWARRAERSRTMELGPLAPDSAARLCRDLLAPAENVPEPAISRLVERTQGIPLLLVELARGLRSAGMIRRSARGQAWYLATDELEHVPDLPLVEWLAGRELASLDPELGAHARLASLLPADLSLAEIAGVLTELERDGHGDDFPLDARVAAERLISRGLLGPGRTARLGFRHALVRDAVAKTVPSREREHVQRAAYRFYQTADLAPAERLPRLAFYAASCGATAEAAAIYLELGHAARDRHAYVDAETRYSRAIELGAGDRAWRWRGAMRYRIGRYDDAMSDLEHALAAVRNQGDGQSQAEILLEQSIVLDFLGAYRSSLALVEEAEQRASELDAPLLRAGVLVGLGTSYLRHARTAESIRAFEDALEVAAPLGDPAYEPTIRALVFLGSQLAATGRYDQAWDVWERSRTLALMRNDPIYLASTLNNRLYYWVHAKNLPALVADLEQAIRILRECGFMVGEWKVRFNLAEQYYFVADIQAAIRHADLAIELERKFIVADQCGLLLRARIAAYTGDLDRVAEILAQIRPGPDHESGSPTWSGEVSSAVLFEMLDLVMRSSTDTEWDQLLRRSAEIIQEPYGIEVLEMRGISLLRRGLFDQGRRFLDEALALAQKLPNLLEPRIRSRLAAL